MALYDPEQEVGTVLERVLTEVGSERYRQLLLKEQGRFEYTLSDDGITDAQRLACIVEEVGEVARDCLARDGLVSDGDASNADLRKELVQVAALAVAWIERL
jgi:NTP pyrophosphatase (non-canonical NTP hydrolase)